MSSARSQRIKIVRAIAEKLKTIDGTGSYETNLNGNAYPTLKFWDEVNNFPSVYLSAGTETREYLPANFTWAYLNISIKAYVKSRDTAQEELEALLADIETCIDKNRMLEFDENKQTTEILVNTITTDEGLLIPYGVGEINIQVRYALDSSYT